MMLKPKSMLLRREMRYLWTASIMYGVNRYMRAIFVLKVALIPAESLLSGSRVLYHV